MKTLLLLCATVLLSGCGDLSSVRVSSGNTKCINGHLYYNSGYGKAPLFDYRTDTPTLIQCRQSKDGIVYEREKIKENENGN